MKTTAAHPTKIEPFSSSEILLAWQSGEEFVVPYVEVRYLCPCAGCVDEHTGERTIQRNSISAAIKPTDVQVVGRYAVQINWSDGHATGIYHFDRLQEICAAQGRRLR